MMMRGPGTMHEWWPVMGPFGWLFMLLFWALVIFGLVALVRWLMLQGRGEERPAPPSESSLEILKKRYARGEISREDYLQMKKDLE